MFVYRYTLGHEIPFINAEASFVMAVMCIEDLHGESKARMDIAHAADEAKRQFVVDASTDVGCDLNKIFLGFLRREFGPDSFSVERVDKKPVDFSLN